MQPTASRSSPPPIRTVTGGLTSLFFVRGIRHVDGAADAVEILRTGDLLAVVEEPDNDVNPRAILLNSKTDERVGWVPDYLVDLMHELREFNGGWPEISVEHVNSAMTPPHLRLLCRLTAPWPRGYEPFSGAKFAAMVHWTS